VEEKLKKTEWRPSLLRNAAPVYDSTPLVDISSNKNIVHIRGNKIQ